MGRFNRMLSEPLLVSSKSSKKIIRLLDEKTLIVIDAAGTEDGEIVNTTLTLEKDITLFDCAVVEDTLIFLVIVAAERYIQGYYLGEDKTVEAFGPVSVPGKINSLALATGPEREIHLFLSITRLGLSSLLQYRYAGKALEFVSELDKGKEAFYALYCVKDFWGSNNLFYLTMANGVDVVKHKYYMFLNKEWSPSYTITDNNFNTCCYSATRDKKNNFYIALIQEREEQVLYCLKREVGGWPEGGWQKEKEIGRGNFLSVPVIKLDEDGKLKVLVKDGEEARIYTFTEGYYNSISTETWPWGRASLYRYRTLSNTDSEYISLEFLREGQFWQEKEKDGAAGEAFIGGYIPGESEEDSRSDEAFLNKALQIMQIKNELEENLKRKERSFARISRQYEERIADLQRQLAAQTTRNKELENKLSRQEAGALNYAAELKKKGNELESLKKEMDKMKELLKEREREIFSIKNNLAGKENDILFLTRQLEKKTNTKGIWNKLSRLFQDK